jgi:hypothetical protein
MSKARDLKTNPENNINMFDLFSLFVPDAKSKYTEVLFRLLKKTPNIDEHKKEIIERLCDEFKIPVDKTKPIPTLQLVFFYRLIESMFNFSDLKTFQKFCEYNERGLVKQNDLSKYSSFDDISNSVSLAEMTATNKDMEKQIVVILDNEEWLVLKPLTFASSKKYGANTKWCTTQHDNPEYFMKYSKRGVLIYTINKKTGYKVATFYSLDKNEPEYSWWNQKDTRIDSLEAEVTNELRIMIHDICKHKNAKTNRFLLTDEERIKEDELLNKRDYLYRYSEPQPVEERDTRIRRIGRVLEDEVQAEESLEEDVTMPVMDNTDMTEPSVFSSSSLSLPSA